MGTSTSTSTSTATLEPTSCVLCSRPTLQPWEPSEHPEVWRCETCGGAYLAQFPSQSAAEALYQDDYYQEGTGARFTGWLDALLVWMKGFRANAIQRHHPGTRTLLDVGCGRGDLLACLKARGIEVCGTQLSRTAAEAARRHRQVNVLVGDLPDLPLPAGHFDVITVFHVLEHLPDPVGHLRIIHRLLAPDGLLVVEVPNFETWGFRYLGRRNLCFDHPHHLFFFTPGALEKVLIRVGFQPDGRARWSLEYAPFTTLQNLLNVLPGPPNRLYRALMANPEGSALRRSPLTWLHGFLGAALTGPALALSLLSAGLGRGNTLRVYARKVS